MRRKICGGERPGHRLPYLTKKESRVLFKVDEKIKRILLLSYKFKEKKLNDVKTANQG